MKTSLKVDEKGNVYLPNKVFFTYLFMAVIMIAVAWAYRENFKTQYDKKIQQMNEKKIDKQKNAEKGGV